MTKNDALLPRFNQDWNNPKPRDIIVVMERIFGLIVYLVGLVIMTTMLLNALEIIDPAGPIATIAFLIFGYLLCITGYLFARKSAPYG